MSGQQPEFDRQEVIVCIVLAVCIGNWLISAIYRVTG
jgi:hypothetical protein